SRVLDHPRRRALSRRLGRRALQRPVVRRQPLRGRLDVVSDRPAVRRHPHARRAARRRGGTQRRLRHRRPPGDAEGAGRDGGALRRPHRARRRGRGAQRRRTVPPRAPRVGAARVAPSWIAHLVSRVVPREGHRGDLLGHDGRAPDRLRGLRHGRAPRHSVPRPGPRRQHQPRATRQGVRGGGAVRIPVHGDAVASDRRDRRAGASARDLLMPAAARALVETLVAAGVEHLFTLSGNQILSIYDAAIGRPLALYHTRHEAAAVHMADAWARLTDRPGVALVTAGPGHLNTISALYGARMEDAPVVLRSGASPRAERGLGAFQEIDQAAATRPVTKAAWTAEDPQRLGDDMARALSLAQSGRPGPVHVSLPGDVLDAEVDETTEARR